MKKVLVFLLAALMLLSLVACGNAAQNQAQPYTTQDRYVFIGSSSELTDVGTPAKPLNPDTVYNSMTYMPQMFYGHYRLIGGSSASEEYGTDCSYTVRTVKGEERNLSTLPIGIQAGKHNLGHVLGDVKDHNWMELSFMRHYSQESTEANLDTFICAYEVEDRKLIITAFETYAYDDTTKTVTYTLSNQSWEYEFSFRGRELTLKSGADSITLTSGLDAYGEHDYVTAEGCLSTGSKSLGGLEMLRTYMGENENRATLGANGDLFNHRSVVAVENNGLMTVTLVTEEDDETLQNTYQCVYFCAGQDGWVLADGTNTYFYNLDYSDYCYGEVQKYLGVELTDELEDLSESKLEQIIEKSNSLLSDLTDAYNAADLNVTVDRSTGEIILDSGVLFGVNETAVSDDGKVFLKQFLDVYTSVVFSDTYEDFVSAIMVEGHTDTNGDYDYNLTLSQDRAESVKAYCLSSECGGANAALLETMLQAKGYSYDRPICNDAGEIDLDASRRVSFRFLIDLNAA